MEGLPTALYTASGVLPHALFLSLSLRGGASSTVPENEACAESKDFGHEAPSSKGLLDDRRSSKRRKSNQSATLFTIPRKKKK